MQDTGGISPSDVMNVVNLWLFYPGAASLASLVTFSM